MNLSIAGQAVDRLAGQPPLHVAGHMGGDGSLVVVGQDADAHGTPDGAPARQDVVLERGEARAVSQAAAVRPLQDLGQAVHVQGVGREVEVGDRVLAQAVEVADIGLDLRPRRGVAHVVGDVADAIDAHEEVDLLELLPVRDHLRREDRPVGVVAQADVPRLAGLAARLDERELLLDQERLPTGEDQLLDVRQQRSQVRPELGVAVPPETLGVDPRLVAPRLLEPRVPDELAQPARGRQPAARLAGLAHDALHVAGVAEPQIEVLDGRVQGAVGRGGRRPGPGSPRSPNCRRHESFSTRRCERRPSDSSW